jgi:hypothetical protein
MSKKFTVKSTKSVTKDEAVSVLRKFLKRESAKASSLDSTVFVREDFIEHLSTFANELDGKSISYSAKSKATAGDSWTDYSITDYQEDYSFEQEEAVTEEAPASSGSHIRFD